MDKKKKSDKMRDKWNLSFSHVLKYNAVFCIAVLLIVCIGGGFLSVQRIQNNVESSIYSVYTQVLYRVEETVKLLQNLADQPEFYDPNVPWIDKAHKLDKMSAQFEYMLACYVDADINVYSVDSEPVSLASRDYMQRLFSTGQNQVTDSFAAGADGKTLNYTIAVPLKNQDEITGCLFAAIYFDDIVNLLKNSAEINNTEGMLIGSAGQIMSSTSGKAYGESVMKTLQEPWIMGMTSDKLEAEMMDNLSGDFWSMKGGNLTYTEYKFVEGTKWHVLCSGNFWSTYLTILPGILMMLAVMAVLSAIMLFLIKRYILSQMEVVDMLVHSVQELEKKIYQDERPDDVDFKEIIRLTGNGLSDGLTGVVTRSVFLNQTEAQLKKLLPGKIAVLCFVDLDDLKKLNDTYGHGVGDVGLKSIGYILREYEKKYDGIVGRYGGDEFVLFLTDLEDESELNDIMGELVGRLKHNIGTGGENIPIQCSVGVSRWRQGCTLEKLIEEADEALYFVKQNGKGYYKINTN